MVVSKKLNNIKAHFKKFTKNKYTIKNNFSKIRTSMGSNPIPGGQSVNYNKCINMGLKTNCDNSTRIAYCKGNAFKNNERQSKCKLCASTSCRNHKDISAVFRM